MLKHIILYIMKVEQKFKNTEKTLTKDGIHCHLSDNRYQKAEILLLFYQPTVAAIEAGKYIALANKETLIAGGPFVLPLAQKHNVKILPADSEHSAIFQVRMHKQ